MFDGDKKCDWKCDTDGDGKPDSNIDGNGSPIKIGSDVILSIESQSSQDIRIYAVKNAIFGGNIDAKGIKPSWTEAQMFAIENNSASGVKLNVLWKNVNNTFTEENNIVYTLDNGTTVLKNQVKAPYNDGILLENIYVPANHTYYYTIKYEFKETGVNQDIDLGKKFNASIVVELAG